MPRSPSATSRYTGTAFALRLDDPQPAETVLLHAASGGAIGATVVTSRDGSDPNSTRKHLDRLVYEDITIQVGAAMPKALFDWITDSWGPSAPARDGAILRADATFTVRSERQFRRAFISETSFPALDGSSKDAGRLSVRLSPTGILPDTNPGTKLQAALGKGPTKLWIVSSFRLEIDGLDCTRVTRIEPFAVRRPVEVVREGGRGGGLTPVPGPVEVPDLRISVEESGAQSWVDWHRAFVVEQATRGADTRNGSIALLGPNPADVLARLRLFGLGIFRLSTETPAGAGSTAVTQLTADLYCERMALEAGTP